MLYSGSTGRESGREPGGSSSYVWGTYNAAIWCLEHTGSYRDCVLVAVNLGDDTDTTACVAGGLAGILYGYEGIPAEWLKVLRGKDVIDACLFSGDFASELKAFVGRFETAIDGRTEEFLRIRESHVHARVPYGLRTFVRRTVPRRGHAKKKCKPL